METWLSSLITILIGVGIIFIWIWFMRRRYSNMFAASRQAPSGRIVAEFWPDTGERYHEVLPVEINGIEVKAPKAHECPRYFFNREVKDTIRYPTDQLFRWLGVSVPAPIVSWFENNPEPIKRPDEEPLVTAQMINALRDDDFAAFAMAASKEIQELERELANALASKIKPMYVYILLIIAAGASTLAAILALMIYDYI